MCGQASNFMGMLYTDVSESSCGRGVPRSPPFVLLQADPAVIAASATVYLYRAACMSQPDRMVSSHKDTAETSPCAHEPLLHTLPRAVTDRGCSGMCRTGAARCGHPMVGDTHVTPSVLLVAGRRGCEVPLVICRGATCLAHVVLVSYKL